MHTLKVTLISATMAIALTAPAFAADPTFVGTWASDLGQCKVDQSRQEAPMVITKSRYDQHETHCSFKSVTPGDQEWKVKAECTVEGSDAPYDFSFVVSGDTLTMTDENGSNDLLRCK